MKLERLYHKIIQFGRECDPRVDKRIDSYPDTAVLHGSPSLDVKKVMVGIDIDVGDLLLADRIREKQGLDLVISHHPEGHAHAAFYGVMQLQVDMLAKVGLSRKVAQELVNERMREVERRVLPGNHMRVPDAAKILGLAFMCVHTPADNQVAHFMTMLFKRKKPKRVGDIVDILQGLPEYQEAKRNLAGPRVILGNPRRPAGKIFIEMTGGTEGSKDAFEKIYKLGVRTLVSMHLSEEHFKKVKDANLNVVIAGHVSSDTLGLNLLLDKIERDGKLEVTGCSGFRRYRR